MKEYFICFDYWNTDINKYFCGIVEIDLSDKSLIGAARRIISDIHPEIGIDTLSIKVISLNNIEVL